MKKIAHNNTEISSRRNFLRQLTNGAAGVALGVYGVPQVVSGKIFGGDKSEVSLVTGTDRREAIFQALKPFKKQIEQGIGEKQVVIKVNAGLAAPKYEINSTHADQIRGILDFLESFYDRQIIITEGTASAKESAFIGFENYKYMTLEKEYNAKLVDANLQPYTQKWIRAAKHHPVPINIIDMYLDPDVYLISAARMKTHDQVVGTYSLKNVVMGAPVCHIKKKVSEKVRMHGGRGSSGGRELSYNMFLVAKMGVQPDLSIIDGVVAIEGNGPWEGEPVEHGITVASTDFVAADRLCSTLMGINPRYMKYLEWCADAGMGTFDLSKIKVKGSDYKKHIIKYEMNKNFERQIAWIHENFDE